MIFTSLLSAKLPSSFQWPSFTSTNTS
ncbi:hypothetical protein JMJ77_0006593, partial [Colletotrichum scovillei]